MEAKHTPGPWIVGKYVRDPRTPDALAVWPESTQIGQRGRAICLVSSLDKVDEMDEANASLIAAAPDLLAACQAISIVHEIRGVIGDHRWGMLAAAIAKATGGGEARHA